MNSLLSVKRILVPQTHWREVLKFFRERGRLGFEAFALWAGKYSETEFVVTNLIIPEQRGCKGPDGVWVQIHGDELHRINLFLYKDGLTLIAQLHSHPASAYHSSTDDEFPIATREGAFSIVVPDFARRDCALSECAVYRLVSKEWTEAAHEIFELR